MSKHGAAVCLLIALGAAARSSAFEVTNCPPKPGSDIRTAAEFINRNMSEIVDQYTFLSEKQRQEIIRKWVGLNLHCSDSRGECVTAGGYAHGGPGNRVNICYYSFGSGATLCELVNVIMHEQGHAHGFRKVPGHNDPTQYVFENDVMYRMGFIARDFCVSSNFNNAPLQGGGDRSLGAKCSEDLQCRSSRCSGDVCVCDEDSDCPQGQSCFEPVGAPNFCRSTSLALGASCTRDDECRSNQCEGNVCVCRHDSDCPSGQVCRTPITGSNRCEKGEDIGSRPVNALCERDSDCLSNKCEFNKCVCNSDSDCPAGQECYRPIGTGNVCRVVGLALGAGCQKDSQCRSNKCEKDKCVCRSDDDCPSGKKCKTPITGQNRCE